METTVQQNTPDTHVDAPESRFDALSRIWHNLRENSSTLLKGILLYQLALAVFIFLIFAPATVSPPTPGGFLSTDDYYHMQAGREIIKQGTLRLNFPWLPMTVLNNEDYVDHHLLFHLYLAPFAYFGGVTATKVATAGVAAGIVVAAWLLLRGLHVRYAMLWALGIFAMSWPFLFRSLMIRTQGAAVLMLILALHFCFQKRYRWLVPLSFLFVWLYNGFIIMPVFVAAYCGAVFVHERRIVWTPVVYSVIGLALGLVINPYFPNNVIFAFDHLTDKVNLDESIPLGAEWSPLNTRRILFNSPGALVLMAMGFGWTFLTGRKRDAAEMTLLGVAVLTGYMAFDALRFLEYFPAFALLFGAVAIGRYPIDTFDGIPYVGDFIKKQARLLVPVAMLLIMLPFSVYILRLTYQQASNVVPHDKFTGATNFIVEHTTPGEIIFNVGFNDFSRMFPDSQRNTWVIGLDPTYLQIADQELWDKYYATVFGRVESPAAVIANDFGARYAISDRRRDDEFYYAAMEDPNLEIVYRDEWLFVWQVRDQLAVPIEGEAGS